MCKSILDSRRAGDDAISQTLNWIVREEGIFVAFNHRSCLSLFYTCCFFESLVPVSHPFKVCFLRTYCGLSVDPKIHKTAPLTSTEQFSWIFEPIDYPKLKKTTDFWAIQSSLKKGYFWIFNFVTELNLHIFTVFIKPIQKDLIFFIPQSLNKLKVILNSIKPPKWKYSSPMCRLANTSYMKEFKLWFKLLKKSNTFFLLKWMFRRFLLARQAIFFQENVLKVSVLK